MVEKRQTKKNLKNGVYLHSATVEDILGSQDEALGKVQGTLTSPKDSYREGVWEEAARLTRFLKGNPS